MRSALTAPVAAIGLALSAGAQVGSFVTTGSGCPLAGNVVHEVLAAGGWDLANSAITYTHTGPTYTVTAAGSFMPPSGTAVDLLSTGDAISSPLALGFTMPYGAGQATFAVQVLTNGYVALQPGTIVDTRCCAGDVASFLEDGPSFAVFGADFDPPAGGRIVYETVQVGPNKAFVVTWDRVEEGGLNGPNTFQCQLWDTGAVVCAYGAMTVGSDTALVGWSAGGGQLEPAQIDFSAGLPYTPTLPLGFPLTLTSVRLPTVGQTFAFTVRNVPSSASAGAWLWGYSKVNFDLSNLGAPSPCFLLTSADAIALPVTVGSPTFSISLPIPNDPLAVGYRWETQIVLADLTLPQSLKVLTSDRATMTVGTPARAWVWAAGGNANTGNPTNLGFWQVYNLSTLLNITRVRFDFANSTDPQHTNDTFDTDQTGSGFTGRLAHGNGTATGCEGFPAYGSEVPTGLVFGGTQAASLCDPMAFRGWIGTNEGPANSYQTLDFGFTDFQPGEFFGFECDTDSPSPAGAGGHAGMEVTVWFSDGSMSVGNLRLASGANALSGPVEVFF